MPWCWTAAPARLPIEQGPALLEAARQAFRLPWTQSAATQTLASATISRQLAIARTRLLQRCLTAASSCKRINLIS